VFVATVENVRRRGVRRVLPIVAVVVLCLLTASSGTARADVNDFTFKSFSADYFLSRDQDRRSRLDVTERSPRSSRSPTRTTASSESFPVATTVIRSRSGSCPRPTGQARRSP
jgi:hypothetical protein